MRRPGYSYPLCRCYILLVALVAAVPGVFAEDTIRRSHGLLWEISKPETVPSHLFGTIHSEAPAVLELAAPVEEAFAAANTVVLEVMLDAGAMIYTSTAMLMTDGRLLSDITGEVLFRRTLAAVQSRGIPEVVLERMKPWAVATTLSMPPSETGRVLDMVLYQRAQGAGKQVGGLETIQEQLDVFDKMAMSDQVSLLRDAVEQSDEIAAVHEALHTAYLQRDLGAMMAINEAVMAEGDQRLARDFQRRLIVERNWRMAERMQPYLEEGKVFFGVGALHLPGEQGLLELLEQRGYSVRMIY